MAVLFALILIGGLVGLVVIVFEMVTAPSEFQAEVSAGREEEPRGR